MVLPIHHSGKRQQPEPKRLCAIQRIYPTHPTHNWFHYSTISIQLNNHTAVYFREAAESRILDIHHSRYRMDLVHFRYYTSITNTPELHRVNNFIFRLSGIRIRSYKTVIIFTRCRTDYIPSDEHKLVRSYRKTVLDIHLLIL